MDEQAINPAQQQTSAPDPEQVAGHMVLQRGVFTGPTSDIDPGLYSTIVGICRHRERRSVQLAPGSTVDTDTYFGRFPAAYYLKWTTITTALGRCPEEAQASVRTVRDK